MKKLENEIFKLEHKVEYRNYANDEFVKENKRKTARIEELEEKYEQFKLVNDIMAALSKPEMQ